MQSTELSDGARLPSGSLRGCRWRRGEPQPRRRQIGVTLTGIRSQKSLDATSAAVGTVALAPEAVLRVSRDGATAVTIGLVKDRSPQRSQTDDFYGDERSLVGRQR